MSNFAGARNSRLAPAKFDMAAESTLEGIHTKRSNTYVLALSDSRGGGNSTISPPLSLAFFIHNRKCFDTLLLVTTAFLL